jgi:hypothetical protein
MPVDAAASEKAVLHHAFTEPEERYHQCHNEHNTPNFKPWRPSF